MMEQEIISALRNFEFDSTAKLIHALDDDEKSALFKRVDSTIWGLLMVSDVDQLPGKTEDELKGCYINIYRTIESLFSFMELDMDNQDLIENKVKPLFGWLCGIYEKHSELMKDQAYELRFNSAILNIVESIPVTERCKFCMTNEGAFLESLDTSLELPNNWSCVGRSLLLNIVTRWESKAKHQYIAVRPELYEYLYIATALGKGYDAGYDERTRFGISPLEQVHRQLQGRDYTKKAFVASDYRLFRSLKRVMSSDWCFSPHHYMPNRDEPFSYVAMILEMSEEEHRKNMLALDNYEILDIAITNSNYDFIIKVINMHVGNERALIIARISKLYIERNVYCIQSSTSSNELRRILFSNKDFRSGLQGVSEQTYSLHTKQSQSSLVTFSIGFFKPNKDGETPSPVSVLPEPIFKEIVELAYKG